MRKFFASLILSIASLTGTSVAPAAEWWPAPGYPAYPYPPPVYVAPMYPPPVYGFGYGYPVPPPAFYFGSGYDPDYRALRYNRYFSRNQDEPKIRGYTLGR